MYVKPRSSLLSLAIILALVFSAISPIIVYADGETTQEPTSTEATSNPTEAAATPQPTEETAATDQAATADPQTTETVAATDAQPTETATPAPDATDTQTTEATSSPDNATATPAPTEEVAPVDPAAVTDAQPTEVAAPADGSTAPAADTTLLSNVPDNTAVTVLDANGNSEPLATQAAADAIATSDPIWCPGNQSPTPGANGCTQSFNSFDALLKFLSGNSTYQGAGTIYVQQGTYQGNDPKKVIDFNSPSYDLSNIKNSDLTVTGGWNPSNSTIDSNNPSTFSGYSILIGSSTNPWGGSLTISNLVVTNAPKSGIELYTTGDVNIKDSKFDHNHRNGAIVRAGRNVNIANSSFSNAATGRSQHVGLDVVSGGATSLFGVIADWNRFTGVNINSTGDVIIGNSDFSHTMHAELNGVSFFDTRLLVNATGVVYSGYGLLVITPSTISLDQITADDNFLWGASLDAGGDIAISNSEFNRNTTAVPGFIDDTGLIVTGDANVALNNVTASDNRLYGALIDAVGTVSINDSNFNNNRGVTTMDGVTTLHGHGLKVNSLADIFIDGTTATNNMLFGGELTAKGDVSVSNSNFSETTTDPGQAAMGKGLSIVSSGNTSLATVVLNHNQTDGADIQASGDVFLDLLAATNNGTDGVVVQNPCTHLSMGEYSGNGQYGLNLGSSSLDLVSPATMFNNGVANIFPANPAVCGVVIGTPPVTTGGSTTPPATDPNTSGVSTGTTNGNSGSVAPTTGTTTSSVSSGTSDVSVAVPSEDSGIRFVGYFNSKTTGSLATDNVSLNDFLADNTLGTADFDPDTGGVFTGRYIVVYANDGLIYIVGLLP